MKESITIKELLFAVLFSLAAVMAVTLFIGTDLSHHTAHISRSFFRNAFFANLTFTGDSFFAFATICVLIFFFNKKDEGIRLLFAVLLTLLLVQLVKNIFGTPPAHLYFEKNTYMFDGEDISYNIISSHTAIAFTLAFFFSTAKRSAATMILLLITATAVAFSRVYTAQDSILAIVLGIAPAAVSMAVTGRISKERSKKLFIKRKRRLHNTQDLSWS